jgi:hypothetical protein
MSQEKSVVDAAGVAAAPPAGKSDIVWDARNCPNGCGPVLRYGMSLRATCQTCGYWWVLDIRTNPPTVRWQEPARDAAAARAAATPNPSGTPGEI